jgi:hypothetical protein
MRRYRPEWILLLEGRQHLVVTGVAPSDAEADITLAIHDRKIRWSAPEDKITITTFDGVIVHPLNPAVLSLKRRGEWVLSCPEDLSPGDLDFENSGSKKPWRYPGFYAHISSGLRLWFEDLRREFRLDDADASVEAAVQPRQPTDQEATSGQKYLPPAAIDPEDSRPKKPWSYGEGYLAHIVPLDLSEEDAENVLRQGAADSRKEPLAQSPKRSKQKATSAQKSLAIKELVAAFLTNPEMRRENENSLRETFSLGPTQFDDVWREARIQAKLTPHARAGRPKKSSQRKSRRKPLIDAIVIFGEKIVRRNPRATISRGLFLENEPASLFAVAHHEPPALTHGEIFRCPIPWPSQSRKQ